MGRHRHDGARTVTHKHIIRDKDRDFHIAHRIYRRQAVNLHTGLLFRKLRTLEV